MAKQLMFSHLASRCPPWRAHIFGPHTVCFALANSETTRFPQIAVHWSVINSHFSQPYAL